MAGWTQLVSGVNSCNLGRDSICSDEEAFEHCLRPFSFEATRPNYISSRLAGLDCFFSGSKLEKSIKAIAYSSLPTIDTRLADAALRVPPESIAKPPAASVVL